MSQKKVNVEEILNISEEDMEALLAGARVLFPPEDPQEDEPPLTAQPKP